MARLESLIADPVLRLENPDEATKGFLEMGGASLQIAYEAPNNYAPRHMRFAINHGPFDRVYKVYTREIHDLGANAAQEKYIQGRIADAIDPFTTNRCWTLNSPLPDPHQAITGTALCPPGTIQANVNEAADRVAHMTASLPQVIALLPAQLLAADHPAVATGIRFAGGAMFWNLSEGIYPVGVIPEHTFNRAEITNLIIDFARIPWATHLLNVQNAAAAKVNGMLDHQVSEKVPGLGDVAAKRLILIAREMEEYKIYKRATLFCALLIFVILYHDDLGPSTATQVQPYDGVF